jgi:hypothetical protein
VKNIFEEMEQSLTEKLNGYRDKILDEPYFLREGEDSYDEKQSPLDECVYIPPMVYNTLPKFYTELLNLFPTKEEKDVFLCGMLPTVASLLPNYYGEHADGTYTPDLFLALVATAGQGKGTAARAFYLAENTDDYLRLNAEQAHHDWISGGQTGEEPPTERCHKIPANASHAALVQALYDNNGRGLVTETEIDSLLAADRNADWGNVSSILRCAFHHETIAIKRKQSYRGKTTLKIPQPCLSVFLSGTPSQFQELMQSTENGLFSRFAVYYHNPPDTWRSHRPTPQSIERKVQIEGSGQKLMVIYQYLQSRTAPMLATLENRHWDVIDTTFAAMQTEFLNEEQRPDLLSSVRRGAIISFRLSMQFAIMRWIDENTIQGFCQHVHSPNATIPITDADVDCAVMLAKLFTYHAQALSSLLPQRRTHVVSTGKTSAMRFLDALPNEFRTRDAIKAASTVGIVQVRTTERYLRQMVSSGLLEKVVNGQYKKRNP